MERRGVSPTDRGRVEAERLLEKLLSREHAHPAAHYIEHAPQVSRELIEYLGSRGRTARLTELSRGVDARILAVLEPRPELVARLYGVGLLPGRRVRILVRAPTCTSSRWARRSSWSLRASVAARDAASWRCAGCC